MAVSIVNGFVCTSSCDVAKARKGEDPHPSSPAAGEPQDAIDHGPAVLFGGALGGHGGKALKPPGAAESSERPTGWNRQFGVDRLA